MYGAMPYDVSGLTLYINPDTLSLADNSPVSTITDQSSNGYVFSQSVSSHMPILKYQYLNGHSVLNFSNPVSQFLGASISETAVMATTANTCWFIFNTTNNDPSGGVGMYFSINPLMTFHLSAYDSGSVIYLEFPWHALTANEPTTNVWHIFTGHQKKDGGTLSIDIDGTQIGSGYYAGTLTLSGATSMFLGGFNPVGQYGYDGKMGPFLWYASDQQHGSSDYNLVYNWLNNTWLESPPSPTPTNTPTNSPTNNFTPIPTNTPTNTPTFSPTNSPTNTPTSTPTNTPTPIPVRFMMLLGVGK